MLFLKFAPNLDLNPSLFPRFHLQFWQKLCKTNYSLLKTAKVMAHDESSELGWNTFVSQSRFFFYI